MHCTMSEFKFSCPHCQQNISAPPEYSGVQINCPTCQTPIVVPQAPAAAPAAAAPAAAPKGKLSKAASTVQHTATSTATAAATIRKAKKPKYGLYIGLGVAAVAAVAAIIFVPKAIDKYNAHKAEVAAAEEAAKAPPPPPPEPGAEEILKKVDATYKGLTSYNAQGESVATLDLSQINPALKAPQTMKSKISVMLARPDLYRVEWTRELNGKTLKGAVWGAGKGDYTQLGPNPVKVKNREGALKTAATSSQTLGVGIADLFFTSTNSLAADMKNYSKSNNETLNGHKCYVLTGQVSSQNMVLWIRKDDSLIAQVELILGGKVDQAALAGLTAMQKAQVQMAMKTRGNITETYNSIEINEPLTADAFQSAIKANANHKPKKPKEPKAARGDRAQAP